MRVHLVMSDGTTDLLKRLALPLAESLNWSVGSSPIAETELNYFFPYLEMQPFVDFDKTPTAAWFTHHEDPEAVPGKDAIWQRVAETVDLRLTSAPMYRDELQSYGMTRLVTPPLDRKKFTFADTPANNGDLKKVGVSGYVYSSGRKGEHLIKHLLKFCVNYDFQIRASGRGWPGATAHYRWDDMQKFYQGLDVYLCTSLIEGIPMPPLEAMACGIPVVIPRGVGLLDTLPDVENLYRYEADNFQDMWRALQEALDAPGLNRESLRGATARFTFEAWQGTHERAFEDLLYDIPPATVTTPWQGKAGVFYVAYGKPSRECARKAITSWKEHVPDIPVALVSDKPLGEGEDIFIEEDDADIGGRSVKTRIYDLAPVEWEYVLYLDADTEIISSDVTFFFDLLEDGWELVFCINPPKYALAREMLRPDNRDECLETFAQLGSDEILQLNGGVFAFRRNGRTANLMRLWHQEWQRFGARDQAALDRALYANPVRIYTLGQEWNTIIRYTEAERSAAVIHHPMSARRWRGKIPGRLDSDAAWDAVARFDGRPE